MASFDDVVEEGVNSTQQDEDVDLWLRARGITPEGADKILAAFATQREPVRPEQSCKRSAGTSGCM